VNNKGNIILTGFMGTGKSSVGQKVAQRLNKRFVDTDVVIATETGKTIAAIFAEQGEAHFRALERAAIARVSEAQDIVVATGGGAMVNEDNARRLKESGMVICLTAAPDVIWARVQNNADRPLLQGENPLDKIRLLLASRAEAYAKADLTIDTSTLSIDEVVETICSQVKTSEKP
jgi:shikimate kinase